MKTNIRWPAITSVATKACLSLAAALALLPSAVEAQCAQWDLSGRWGIVQGPTTVDVDLHQQGSVITGKAEYTVSYKGTSGVLGIGAKPPSLTWVHGTFQGTIKENRRIYAEIHWQNNNTIGEYYGYIDPDGSMGGGVNEKGSNHGDRWTSDRRMKCTGPISSPPPLKAKAPPARDANGLVKGLSALAHGTPIPARTIKQTGHAAASASAPNAAAPAAAPAARAVPGITASPSVVTIPAGQTQGTTSLTWDAGRDHPYAEVWVRVGDQDETKIVEQGKGSRQVTVVPGTANLYILTDAGQQLATVVVKSK